MSWEGSISIRAMPRPLSWNDCSNIDPGKREEVNIPMPIVWKNDQGALRSHPQEPLSHSMHGRKRHIRHGAKPAGSASWGRLQARERRVWPSRQSDGCLDRYKGLDDSLSRLFAGRKRLPVARKPQPLPARWRLIASTTMR
jgi:hypothetical protein